MHYVTSVLIVSKILLFADVRTGDAAPGDAQVNAQRGLQELRALIVRQIANGPAPVGTGVTCVRKVFARFTFRNILIRYFENVAFHYVGTVFAHVPFRDLLTYNFKQLWFACVRKVFARFEFRNILIHYFRKVAFYYVRRVFAHERLKILSSPPSRHLKMSVTNEKP